MPSFVSGVLDAYVFPKIISELFLLSSLPFNFWLNYLELFVYSGLIFELFRLDHRSFQFRIHF